MALKTKDNWDESLSSIESWIADIRNWMNRNMQKLDETKTKFIVLSPKQQTKETESVHIKMDQVTKKISAFVRSLVLMFMYTPNVEAGKFHILVLLMLNKTTRSYL